MKMWISRNKTGIVHLFLNRPKLKSNGAEWYDPNEFDLLLHDTDFPEVTFENSPQEVELKLIQPENKREE